MSDLEALSRSDLLALHAAVTSELQRRGVTRSANSPTGDLAENLFCRAFGWKIASKSNDAADAVDQDGRPIQIKARRITPHNRSRQLGQIRKLPDKGFDVLAAILFSEDYRVLKAALIPHARVVELAKYVQHTNSWRFLFRDAVMAFPDVQDVTKRLHAAEEAWADDLAG